MGGLGKAEKGRRYSTGKPPMPRHELVDSPYAAARLAVAVVIMVAGTSGMYIISVVLPAIQADFGVSRADASAPYFFLLVGFVLGGLLMGQLADRFGVTVPLVLGGAGLGLGLVLASNATSLWTFNLAHGLLIGFLGCSSTFSPLLADTSLWWERRRGIA